jgi:hypothetical protein
VSTINYRGTPEEVRRLLRTLPAMLSGKSPDPYGIVRGIQLRVANVVLSKIQQAFIVKSRGGVGSDGIQWPPLKPETIAQRTVSKADRKRAGIGEREWRERQRGLLTPEQNRLWRKKFSRSLAWLRLDMGEREARSRAAQIAWRYVKEELGAKTRLEAFGKRVVDSLRDTGELFRSLSAGVEDQLSGAPGQIVRIPAGTIIVGTTDRAPQPVLLGINPDGTLRWVMTPAGLPTTVPSSHFDIYSSPAIGSDGIVYVGQEFGRVYAVDAQTGAERWYVSTGDLGGITWSSPAITTSGLLIINTLQGAVLAIETPSRGLQAGAAWPRFRGGNHSAGRR